MKVIICNTTPVLSFALPAFFSNSENTGPTTETSERNVSSAVGRLIAAFLSAFLQGKHAFVEQQSLAGTTLISSVFSNTHMIARVGISKTSPRHGRHSTIFSEAQMCGFGFTSLVVRWTTPCKKGVVAIDGKTSTSKNQTITFETINPNQNSCAL